MAKLKTGTTIGGSTAWHSGNDGTGSGLDADLLDGLHESTFMRKSANSTLDMNNNNITGVNALYFEDPGPSEGLEWVGGSVWKIFESPDDLTTNTGGNLQFTTGSTPTLRMRISTAGEVTATNFNTTSDITLKENVKPIENALDKVNALNGVEFDWKESGKHSIGFIAQDVEKVLPEMVSGEGNNIKTVNYSQIVSVLTEAVKELTEQNKIMAAEIQILKDKA